MLLIYLSIRSRVRSAVLPPVLLLLSVLLGLHRLDLLCFPAAPVRGRRPLLLGSMLSGRRVPRRTPTRVAFGSLALRRFRRRPAFDVGVCVSISFGVPIEPSVSFPSSAVSHAPVVVCRSASRSSCLNLSRRDESLTTSIEEPFLWFCGSSVDTTGTSMAVPVPDAIGQDPGPPENERCTWVRRPPTPSTPITRGATDDNVEVPWVQDPRGFRGSAAPLWGRSLRERGAAEHRMGLNWGDPLPTPRIMTDESRLTSGRGGVRPRGSPSGERRTFE